MRDNQRHLGGEEFPVRTSGVVPPIDHHASGFPLFGCTQPCGALLTSWATTTHTHTHGHDTQHLSALSPLSLCAHFSVTFFFPPVLTNITCTSSSIPLCSSPSIFSPTFKLLLLSHCPSRANSVTQHVNITSAPRPLTWGSRIIRDHGSHPRIDLQEADHHLQSC